MRLQDAADLWGFMVQFGPKLFSVGHFTQKPVACERLFMQNRHWRRVLRTRQRHRFPKNLGKIHGTNDLLS